MNDNIFANNTQETISEKYVSLTEIMGYPTKMLDSEKFSELDEKLKEKIYWALNKPEEIIKKNGTTMKQQKEEKKDREKKWGNNMIGQINNGQWTTILGERLVFDILKILGQNPRKVVKKEGFEPDWETDEYMYEVKTSNWWVDGTAGEKVYGTFIKYQKVPELYGKPLRIVCLANQENELEFGKTKYFGEEVTEKTKKILELAKTWDIEYIRFRDLVNPIIQ
jgi:hypothetical protein|uniref:Uncharacterized protein n=1 Tax=viral metagenome TaxID=1070528 RepID=A0A6C0FB99_9ZZZZ|tara:strand:+ start:52477 stop:53145 length:669 start_codon:yes stop_codon:yes gene_type:complete